MRRFYLIGFSILMAFDTLGQMGFKFAAISTAPATFDLEWLKRIVMERWIYLAVTGYVGAFFTWMTLLKHAPVGPAFAASHLEILCVLFLSVWLLGERLSVVQILGGLLIFCGIALLGIKKEGVPD